MKHHVRDVYRLMAMCGLDPRKAINVVRGLPFYIGDLRRLRKQHKLRDEFPFGRFYPCLEDRRSDSGSARGHYFHQDLLVARRIFASVPLRHGDVGSRIDGFVAHVASFRPIDVLDIRPLSMVIPNINFLQVDLMAPVSDDLLERFDSLSCLHALEHFGLGRYGDPINCDGHLVGLHNMHRMLRPGGKFYLSVPIGPQRIEFNAHRVFSLPYLLQRLDRDYRIDRFSFVDDAGDLHDDVPMHRPSVERSFDCFYGCGILEMTKL